MPDAKTGKFTAKQKREAVQIASDMFRTNRYTVVQCVEATGVSQSSFYSFLRGNEKLRGIWDQAKEERGEKHRAEMVVAAREGAYKLMRGERKTLTTTLEDADGNVISKTKRQVYYPPSAAVVMGVLRHIDRESIPEESLVTVQHDVPVINVMHRVSTSTEENATADQTTPELSDGDEQTDGRD
jgi:hypothetical protein